MSGLQNDKADHVNAVVDIHCVDNGVANDHDLNDLSCP